MATTTPNYGWPVPTSTDYVKDGATAIEALGDAIDATVFGLGVSGLSFIESQSFTTVASFSFSNDVFTSTYDNYLILLYCTASGNVALQWRGRIAGVDTTLTNYSHQQLTAESTSVSAARTTGQSSSRFGQINSLAPANATSLTIFTPKAALNTRSISQTFQSVGNASLEFDGGGYSLTTSFDSLTIFPSSGTFTGKASLYGYSI